MVDQDDDTALEAPQSRPPTLDDLLKVVDALNRAQARYVVVGGMAVIQLGFVRATEDIDLLVESSDDNLARLKCALAVLPDNAVREVEPGDLDEYVVIRVADEIVVDLMKSACGVDYATAAAEVDIVEIDGVRIPFANAPLMWRLKQTVRAKDEVDRAFLQRVLAERDKGAATSGRGQSPSAKPALLSRRWVGVAVSVLHVLIGTAVALALWAGRIPWALGLLLLVSTSLSVYALVRRIPPE